LLLFSLIDEKSAEEESVSMSAFTILSAAKAIRAFILKEPSITEITISSFFNS
jgi:hypothetical protein